MTTSVSINLGYTRNMGNFESLRVDIGVTDAVRQGETVDSATERVYSFVEKKLIEKVQEVEKELK